MRIAFLFCNHVCKSDFIIFANKTLYFPSFCVSELSFPAILTLHVFFFTRKYRICYIGSGFICVEKY